MKTQQTNSQNLVEFLHEIALDSLENSKKYHAKEIVSLAEWFDGRSDSLENSAEWIQQSMELGNRTPAALVEFLLERAEKSAVESTRWLDKGNQRMVDWFEGRSSGFKMAAEFARELI